MADITVSSNVDTMLKSASNAEILSNIGAGSATTVLENGGNINQLITELEDKAGKASPAFTGSIDLSSYNSTSRSETVTSSSPNQNNQALTDDTVTNLCVDPSGNVVRGSQEATWKFSNAQLNALTANTVILLEAPGAGKFIIVEDSNWLMESDPTAIGTFTADLKCEIKGIGIYSVATQILRDKLVAIAAPAFNGLGMYSRDVPNADKESRANEAMTIRAPTATGFTRGTTPFPARCISVTLKIKYRVYDSTTF